MEEGMKIMYVDNYICEGIIYKKNREAYKKGGS